MADRKEKDLKLSIVTVNYRTDELVLDLLKKLLPHPEVEIIVVDNSPTDSLKTKLPKRNDIKYFFANKNLGFSGGNNLGISKAKGKWLFLLNSDTLVSTNEILRLLTLTETSKHLVSAPQLVQPDGKIQDNVGNFDSLSKNAINYLFARPRFLDCQESAKPTEVDLLTGAAMLIHRSVLDKIGLLDDKNFFMYYEDLDFSYRLHLAGIKVLYVPEIEVVHFGGASSDQDARQKNKNYQQGLQTYLKKHRGSIANFANNLFHFLA